jgi:hypothetical protein
MTTFQRAVRAAIAWASLLLAPGVAFAGAPSPLPVPSVMPLTSGNVAVMLRMPDGALIVGGGFSSVDTVARANLARITPEGELDETWHPAVDGAVLALAYDPNSDAVYIGGMFDTVDGQPQAHIAKLLADGTLDASWHPAVNNAVSTMAVDPSGGDVYIAGIGWTINGHLRGAIARFTSDGVLDAWDPFVHGNVSALSFDWANGVLYAGGQFDSVGSTIRRGLAKISIVDASVDPTWNPQPNIASVYTVQYDAVHHFVYVGGQFLNVGGASRNRIARLDPNGTGAADAWNPNANGDVTGIAVDAAHASVYAIGYFQQVGGQTGGVAKLADTGIGTPDPAWHVSAFPTTMTLDPSSGHVLIGGLFTNVGGTRRLGYSELNTAGAATGARIDFENPATIGAVADLADHSVVIGGNFVKIGSVDRQCLARIRPDGALDDVWAPVIDNTVYAIMPTPDGASIYIGGPFSIVNGVFRRSLARLSTSGSGALDTQWTPNPDNAINSMLLSPDGGTLYVGGSFTRFDTVQHLGLAKLSTSGSGAADANWTPSVDSLVTSLAFAPGGSAIDIGGWFTHVGITARARLARIDAAGTGALDPAWNPSADGLVEALKRNSDGYLYVGGRFDAIGGVARSRIARLDAAGAVDPAWAPEADGDVLALALSADGEALHLAGSFSNVGGLARARIARVSTAAGAAVDAGWDPGINADVLTLKLSRDGTTLFAGGRFSAVGEASRMSITALPLPGSYATTSAIVQVDPAAAVVGQPVTVAVTVASDDGTPGGEALIGDGTTTCMATLDGNGAGSCTLAFAHAGPRELSAAYPGAGDFAGSISPGVALVVDRAATALAILSAAPDPSIPGEPVAVTAALGVVAPGAGAPVGDIVVGDGVDACTIAAGDTSCELALTTRGPRTLTATFAGDADFAPSSDSVAHSVNRLPVAGVDVYDAIEDTTFATDATHGVLANDVDADGDALVVANAGTFAASGIGGTIELAPDGSFAYTPPPDANGVATFDYTVTDGRESVNATAMITLTAVNDAPTPGSFANPQWPAGTSGNQSIAAFATVLAFGPPDEAGQQVLAWHVRTIADDAGVLSSAVTIDADGALHVPLSGHAGTATLGVTLQDDGGTANGGVDTSAESVFTVTVGDTVDAIFASGFEAS